MADVTEFYPATTPPKQDISIPTPQATELKDTHDTTLSNTRQAYGSKIPSQEPVTPNQRPPIKRGAAVPNAYSRINALNTATHVAMQTLLDPFNMYTTLLSGFSDVFHVLKRNGNDKPLTASDEAWKHAMEVVQRHAQRNLTRAELKRATRRKEQQGKQVERLVLAARKYAMPLIILGAFFVGADYIQNKFTTPTPNNNPTQLYDTEAQQGNLTIPLSKLDQIMANPSKYGITSDHNQFSLTGLSGDSKYIRFIDAQPAMVVDSSGQTVNGYREEFILNTGNGNSYTISFDSTTYNPEDPTTYQYFNPGYSYTIRLQLVGSTLQMTSEPSVTGFNTVTTASSTQQGSIKNEGSSATIF